MQTFSAKSGYLATVSVGTFPGNEISVKNWSATFSCQSASETNSMSGAYPIKLVTYLGASGSFEMTRNFGAGQNPYGAPFNLREGQFLTAVNLIENQSGRGNLDQAQYVWVCTNCLIERITPKENIAGSAAETVTVMWTVSGPTGTVTAPTG